MNFTPEQLKIVNELKKKYSIRNVRTFRGMEGTGMNSTLYINGKKACFVDDEAQGGPLNCDWKVLEKLNKELVNVGKVKYDENDSNDFEFTFDAEMFLNLLIEEELENKTLRKKCKNKTLFITNNLKKGQYIEINRPYSLEIKTYLKNKYSTELKEIINERF